jgi:hypothetical protein
MSPCLQEWAFDPVSWHLDPCPTQKSVVGRCKASPLRWWFLGLVAVLPARRVGPGPRAPWTASSPCGYISGGRWAVVR